MPRGFHERIAEYQLANLQQTQWEAIIAADESLWMNAAARRIVLEANTRAKLDDLERSHKIHGVFLSPPLARLLERMRECVAAVTHERTQ